MLVDADTDRGLRHPLFHADRNGCLYVLDRATGEVLSATQFGHVTTSTGVDMKTGLIAYVRRMARRSGAPGPPERSPPRRGARELARSTELAHGGNRMKTWTKPTLEVVNMNAEIGGYQPDFDDGPDAVKRGQAPPAAADARGQPAEPAPDAAALPTPGRQS